MGQVTAQDSGVINAVNIALDHGGITVNDTEGQLLLQATGNITQMRLQTVLGLNR